MCRKCSHLKKTGAKPHFPAKETDHNNYKQDQPDAQENNSKIAKRSHCKICEAKKKRQLFMRDNLTHRNIGRLTISQELWGVTADLFCGHG